MKKLLIVLIGFIPMMISHGDRHLGNAAGASPALKEENGKRKSSYRLPFFRLVFEINRLIIWKLQN